MLMNRLHIDKRWQISSIKIKITQFGPPYFSTVNSEIKVKVILYTLSCTPPLNNLVTNMKQY